MALPIFPVRLQTSIVGRSELNFRVRNGNGWTLALISTNCIIATDLRQKQTIVFSISQRHRRSDLGDPYRIRTDVNGVRGRCLNHLTNGPFGTACSGIVLSEHWFPNDFCLVHLQGLEPWTP